MPSIDFWVLYTYITIIFILMYRHFTHRCDDIDEEDDKWYEDTSGFIDAMKRHEQVKPDENGIIGKLTSSDGEEYYAVIIPKEELDQAIKEREEAIKNDKQKR